MRLATPEPDSPCVPLPVGPDDAMDLLCLGRLTGCSEVTLAGVQALEATAPHLPMELASPS